jgi:hypothetical protein
MTSDREYYRTELLHAHVADCWNSGNYAHLEQRFTPDVSFVHFGSEQCGPGAIREHIKELRKRVHNLNLSIDNTVVTESTTTVCWTCSGTSPSDDTGKSIRLRGKAHFKFYGERVMMVHGLPDRIQVIRAFGGLI